MLEEAHDLFHKILNKQWHSIVTPILNDDICHIDDRGCTALHTALHFQAPLSVIVILIDAYPAATEIENHLGYTPLQAAISSNNDEIIQLLIKTQPVAANQLNIIGTSPLHDAIRRRRSFNIIRDLINAAPDVMLKPNRKGETPFETFFTSWDICLRQFLANNSILISTSYSRYEILKQKVILDGDSFDIKYLYDITCLLLQTAYPFLIDRFSNNTNKNNRWLALHSAYVSKYCPWSFCQLLLHLHPDQVSKQDINGHLPLIHCINANDNKSEIYNSIFKCRSCRSTSCNVIYKWGKMIHGQLYCDDCVSNHMCIDKAKCLVVTRDEENERLTSLFYLIRENPSIVS